MVQKAAAFRSRPDGTQVCPLLGLVFLTAAQAAALLGTGAEHEEVLGALDATTGSGSA